MSVNDYPISKASFFDLDHTLLNVNSSFCFGKYLYKQGALSLSQLIQLGPVYFLHKAGIFSAKTLHSLVFKRLFKGLPRSFFKQHLDLFLKDNFEGMLYAPAIERLKAAQLSGHYVAILSNSPDFLVEGFARKLQVNHFEGSIYSVDEAQRFSHIKQLIQGEDKAASIANTLKSREIKKENATIYSDSILDLEFLLSGGVQVGVNPDAKLRALCQKYSWEVI